MTKWIGSTAAALAIAAIGSGGIATAQVHPAPAAGATATPPPNAIRPFAPPGPKDHDPVTARALERFNGERFALFIHWGIYTQAGGVLRGKRWYGLSEWLMYHSQAPSSEYLQLAKAFNPTGYDAKAWVATAKAAGVRYIVITTKHHDGFAMYDSRVSPNTIVRATPFRRDPIRELVDEARKAGIGIGFYYSQYQDWTERDGGGNIWEFDPKTADFERYFNAKVVPQVTEILTRYGPVREIWFDTPGPMKPVYSKRLYDLVKKLQPATLVNSRLGNGYGDYSSPADSEVLPAALARSDWEAIYPHNHSWGYSQFDTDYKSTDDLVTLLVLSASRGGNFMLNVGPDATGRFPEPTSRRLLGVGEWLKLNGEGIYGTARSPLPQQPWGEATVKGNRLYLHVMDRPTDNVIRITGIDGATATRASLLADGRILPLAREGAAWTIALPTDLPAARVTTIALDLDAAPRVNVAAPAQVSRSHRRIAFDIANAQRGDGVTLMRVDSSPLPDDNRKFYTVAGLTDPSRKVGWPIDVTAPGEYRVLVQYQATDAQSKDADGRDREGSVRVAGQRLLFNIRSTGTLDRHKPAPVVTHSVGIVRFDRSGTHMLEIAPVASGPELFALRTVYLEPVN